MISRRDRGIYIGGVPLSTPPIIAKDSPPPHFPNPLKYMLYEFFVVKQKSGIQETLTLLACAVGWCEIELLLKGQNPQADYGSMIITEQLLLKKNGHRMY